MNMPRDIEVLTKQETEKKQRQIDENRAAYNLWRLNYEKGILCATRAFVAGDGHIAVVTVPKGKKKSVYSKT